MAGKCSTKIELVHRAADTMIKDEEYVCTLDEASVKKAREELKENPEDRLAAVKTLREWVTCQPHIKWPATDIHTMLLFLRGAKFSQLRAREMLEGNLLMRKDTPHWFNNIDTHDEKLHLILDDGFTVPLPGRDEDGRQVLLQRIGASDPYYKKYSKNDTMRIGMLLGLLAQRTEMTQVNGMVYIIDFSGVTAKHISNLMGNRDIQNWHKKWQKHSPGRIKKMIMYNAGKFVEALLAFIRPFMSKKYQERIHVSDTAEDLYKQVPMSMLPEEYLPDDYKGSTAGSVKQLAANFKAEIMKLRDDMLWRTGEEFSIDMSKKPETTEVPTQHFRKLNV